MRRFSAVELLVLLCNLGLAALFLWPARVKSRAVAERTRCAGNLRQLGQAAIQYADDKRFFPHVGRIVQLDGDWTTSDPGKSLRALLWYGYLDSVEGWVCPASLDHARLRGVPDRRWFWSSWRADGTVTGGPGARGGSLVRSPFVDGLPDHSLDGTDEVSYGWIRRGWNVNTRSTALLSADRSLRRPGSERTGTRGEAGNHADGWNALLSDGAVTWLELGDARAATLTDTRPVGEFLAMQEPPDRW